MKSFVTGTPQYPTSDEQEKLQEVQGFFREGIPESVSLVDELFAERRYEAARDRKRHK
jgi:hypothetical protein